MLSGTRARPRRGFSPSFTAVVCCCGLALAVLTLAPLLVSETALPLAATRVDEPQQEKQQSDDEEHVGALADRKDVGAETDAKASQQQQQEEQKRLQQEEVGNQKQRQETEEQEGVVPEEKTLGGEASAKASPQEQHEEEEEEQQRERQKEEEEDQIGAFADGKDAGAEADAKSLQQEEQKPQEQEEVEQHRQRHQEETEQQRKQQEHEEEQPHQQQPLHQAEEEEREREKEKEREKEQQQLLQAEEEAREREKEKEKEREKEQQQQEQQQQEEQEAQRQRQVAEEQVGVAPEYKGAGVEVDAKASPQEQHQEQEEQQQQPLHQAEEEREREKDKEKERENEEQQQQQEEEVVDQKQRQEAEEPVGLVPEGKVAGEAGAETKPLRSVGICMTGQLMRVEFELKMANIIQPLADYFERVDVLALLDMKSLRFTNHVVGGQKGLPKNMVQIFPTAEDLRVGLLNEKLPGETQVIDFTQPEDPLLHPDYHHIISEMRPAGPNSKPDVVAAYSLNRVLNHARQWSAFQECQRVLKQQELRRGERYDVIVRLRDDAAALVPINVEEIVRELQERGVHRTVISPTCSSNYGLNDKFQIMGRQMGMTFMGDVLEDLYTNFVTVNATRRIRNPESFLLNVLDVHAADVLHMSPEYLRVVPVRLFPLDEKGGGMEGHLKACLKFTGHNGMGTLGVKCVRQRAWFGEVHHNPKFSKGDDFCTNYTALVEDFAPTRLPQLRSGG